MTENGAFHYHAARSADLVGIDACVIAHPSINEYINAPKTPFSNERQSVELAFMPDHRVSVFKVHADRSTELGFRQINTAVSKILTNTVSNIIDEQLRGTNAMQGQQTLLDLYCGHGAWTRHIAQRHPSLSILGIDNSEQNIRTARSEAANLNNANFLVSRAETALKKSTTHHDFVIVDPPRAGLSTAVVEALTEFKTPTLLYISCHPATLARDLAALTEGGYTVDFVQPFDMFPQTPHVESLAILRSAV